MYQIEDLEGKIINADCMDILKQMPDNSVDCVFTDLPYKQEFHGRGMCRTRPNYLKINEYGSNKDLDYTELFSICWKKLKKKNFFSFCDKETKYELITIAKQYGFGYKELCFCKTSPTPFCNNQWLPDVEYGVHIFKDLEVMGDYKTKRSFWVMANFKEEGQTHPTAKKVSVCEQILENITRGGDLVLDPFGGSGTTAIACHRLKRRFICIEKDKEYWQKSCERLKWEQATPQLF